MVATAIDTRTATATRSSPAETQQPATQHQPSTASPTSLNTLPHRNTLSIPTLRFRTATRYLYLLYSYYCSSYICFSSIKIAFEIAFGSPQSCCTPQSRRPASSRRDDLRRAAARLSGQTLRAGIYYDYDSSNTLTPCWLHLLVPSARLQHLPSCGNTIPAVPSWVAELLPHSRERLGEIGKAPPKICYFPQFSTYSSKIPFASHAYSHFLCLQSLLP